MERVEVDGVGTAYEVFGSGPPLLLLTGLGGVGRAWGAHRERFAERFTTIVPDHRGTGESDAPRDGYTIGAHAADMAAVVAAVGLGPAHLVGSSTGGAIGQTMAIDHPESLRSLVAVSSWAGPDPFFEAQFVARRKVLVDSGPRAYAEASSLFLFDPAFASRHPERVREWVDKASSGPSDPEVMAQRIDMIRAHDERHRLGGIAVPTLVLVGEADICTPPYLSEELAAGIPRATLQVLPGGHFVYLEHPDAFFDAVVSFAEAQ
ncbi:MAG: alpha/beta fold hydrolase [Acidimicrobiia bacterium]|nr:alpha/beta fold hydrolase [Acidimicrobiia bacterium]